MDTRNDRANRKYNNLFRLENELYHDIAVKMGLSDSAFGILYWLDDLGDGCLQRDVCVASGLTKQTVNSSVHKLERTGFVELRVEQGAARTCTLPRLVARWWRSASGRWRKRDGRVRCDGLAGQRRAAAADPSAS